MHIKTRFALLATLLLVSAAPAAPARAELPDLRAEVVEWAVGPCLRVQMALEAEAMDAAVVEAGVGLDEAVTIMLATREEAVDLVVAQMRPGAPWSERAQFYAGLLRGCLRGLDLE